MNSAVGHSHLTDDDAALRLPEGAFPPAEIDIPTMPGLITGLLTAGIIGPVVRPRDKAVLNANTGHPLQARGQTKIGVLTGMKNTLATGILGLTAHCRNEEGLTMVCVVDLSCLKPTWDQW